MGAQGRTQTTIRLMAFSSSRMLPGQEWSVKVRIIAGETAMARPYAALNRRREWSASTGISSRRSRSGGTRIEITLSR
jgi:hypothetical protein